MLGHYNNVYRSLLIIPGSSHDKEPEGGGEREREGHVLAFSPQHMVALLIIRVIDIQVSWPFYLRVTGFLDFVHPEF
jgi:hypothetical protein